MKKRFLAVFLTLALCLGLMPTAAFAAGETAAGPGQTDLGGVVSIDDYYSKGIVDSTGALWMWSSYLKDTPVKVMEDVASIGRGGYMEIAALKKDGSLWTIASSYEDFAAEKLLDNVAIVDDMYAIKTDGTLWAVSSPSGATKIMDDAASIHGDLVIKIDKTLWEIISDYNYDDVSGSGTTTYKVEKLLDDVVSAARYSDSYAAIKTDGSLWTWGFNQWGILGSGQTGWYESDTPTKIMDDVISIDIVGCSAAAIKADGSLWMWGFNDEGQIGTDDGSYLDQNIYWCCPSPQKIMDGVQAVSLAPFSHTAALKTDGTLWAWGSGKYGGTLYGEADLDYGPTKVLDNVAYVDTSAVIDGAGMEGDPCYGLTIAIKTDGTVWMWGYSHEPDRYSDETYDDTYSKTPVQLGSLRVNVGSAVPSTPSFTDVPDWCAAPVSWAVDKEITNGTGDNKFSPQDLCKHAEILTFLWRTAGKPNSDAALPMDIARKNVDWATAALRWATEKGMIDGALDPNARCTRSEAVTYIWKALGGAEADGEQTFTDVPANADYAKAVAWAVANGVTNGYEDGTFGPGKTCSRGEIVTFLHRAYVEEARLTAK